MAGGRSAAFHSKLNLNSSSGQTKRLTLLLPVTSLFCDEATSPKLWLTINNGHSRI